VPQLRNGDNAKGSATRLTVYPTGGANEKSEERQPTWNRQRDPIGGFLGLQQRQFERQPRRFYKESVCALCTLAWDARGGSSRGHRSGILGIKVVAFGTARSSSWNHVAALGQRLTLWADQMTFVGSFLRVGLVAGGWQILPRGTGLNPCTIETRGGAESFLRFMQERFGF
jgi:hypothetical protein